MFNAPLVAHKVDNPKQAAHDYAVWCCKEGLSPVFVSPEADGSVIVRPLASEKDATVEACHYTRKEAT